MNELIKEIWGKAWNAYIGPDGILDGKDADDFYEKFAELIVKECVVISRTSTDGFSAGRRMEEHFGVDE